MVRVTPTFLRRSKKAYSLVELICVMSMLMITVSIGVICIKNYNNIRNQIEIKSFSNEILSFINDTRIYCKSRKTNGKIFINPVLNSFVFYKDEEKGEIEDKLSAPIGFKLYPLLIAHGEIDIDEDGMTADACTIQCRDTEGKLHILTVCVGTGNVKIKE